MMNNLYLSRSGVPNFKKKVCKLPTFQNKDILTRASSIFTKKVEISTAELT